jgi:hypothetical protein
MKHKHRIVPGHRGGEYVEGNVLEVEIVECDQQTSSHAMWHYAEWRLWGDGRDREAWQGLAGFKGKEEIIRALQDLGRAKGRATNMQMFADGVHPLTSPEVQRKAVEASQATQQKMKEVGLHPFQNPELRARNAEADRKKRKEEWEKGEAHLQKPDVIEKRKKSSSKSRSTQNSKKVKCPHCGKEGGHTNIKRYHFDNCKFKGDPTG